MDRGFTSAFYHKKRRLLGGLFVLSTAFPSSLKLRISKQPICRKQKMKHQNFFIRIEALLKTPSRSTTRRHPVYAKSATCRAFSFVDFY